MKIERYQAYKDSEIEWLSEIPKDWKVKRIKNISNISYGLSQPPKYLEEGLPLIRATNIEKGKVVDKGLVFISPDDVPYERNPILKENDIVVVRSGAYTADSAIIPKKYHGAIAGFDMVLRPCNIHAKYLSYTLLSNYLLKDQLILSSFRAAQPHLNKEELGTALIVYPSLFEQKAIAHYLDTKTAQIDRKIDLLTQKAMLYSDLKQSLINETVTRGLDKSVLVKDSGIEWLGEVPEHWGLCKLKDITFYQEGPGIMADDFQEKGIPLIRISGMKGKRVSLDGCNYLDPTKVSNKWKHFKLQQGDLLVSASATTGIVAKVSEETIGAIPYTGLIRFKPRRGIALNYLQYFLSASVFINQIELQKSGTTIQHYGPTHLSRVFAILPPLLEQKEIADYLDIKTTKIDQIIQTINTKIEKLKELRKTLINDVVTGKIKVV